MGTEVVRGERKSPYIYKTKLYQIPVLNNHCELLADKEGQRDNTPDMQVQKKKKKKTTIKQN
jgi:hypothetical protein